MMKKFIIGVTLVALALGMCSSAFAYSRRSGYRGGPVIAAGIKKYTVATLPPNAVARVAAVTDGLSASDCTVGGGSTAVLCWNNGSAWASIGSGTADLTSSVTWTIGDGSSGDVVVTYDGDSGTDGVQTYDVSEDAFVFSNVLKFLADAAPTTDTVADSAFDTNAWAAGRGTLQLYDGTSNVYLVGCDAGDLPSDGQVCKWKTGGLPKWENDDNTAGMTGADTCVSFFDGTDNPSCDTADFNYNKTTNVLTVGSVATAPTATPTQEFYDSDTTDGDNNAQVQVNCTDTGTGAEDCDITISQQIAGAMTAVITLDADGVIALGRDATVPDEAYASGWNASLEVPTKNAVYDKIEAITTTVTDTKCIWFENPVAADDFKSVITNKTSVAWTLTEMWGESDQTVNFDFQVDDGTPADVNGADISPAAGEAEDTSLSGDTTLAAGEELDLAITSVSGTPTWFSGCITFTKPSI